MSGTEQLFESDDDAYDEFDCENNDDEETEGIVMKEEENDGIVVKEDVSETDYNVLESGNQSAGNGKWWAFVTINFTDKFF